jgi:hypothetical protein
MNVPSIHSKLLICHHPAIGSVNAIPHKECYTRDTFKNAMFIGGVGGVEEKALAVMANTTEASLSVQFFTSNDCLPENRIKDADVREGCSSNAQNNPKDGWKSWQVWDACLNKPGDCDLMDD